jgi:hypothetical protein
MTSRDATQSVSLFSCATRRSQLSLQLGKAPQPRPEELQNAALLAMDIAISLTLSANLKPSVFDRPQVSKCCVHVGQGYSPDMHERT